MSTIAEKLHRLADLAHEQTTTDPERYSWSKDRGVTWCFDEVTGLLRAVHPQDFAAVG